MDIDTIMQTARLLVEEWAEEIIEPAPGWMDVYLSKPDDLLPAVTGLRVKRLGYLSAITGLDLGEEANALEVIYHFCPGKAIINLRIRLDRDAPFIPSLYEIVPSAVPFEREIKETLGIEITVLREAGHLYLPDDWPLFTYPLRKDFDPKELPLRVDKG